MSSYTVNATMTVAAWVTVEAESPADAVEQAHAIDASAFEFDMGTAEVEFNVTPEVEPA